MSPRNGLTQPIKHFPRLFTKAINIVTRNHLICHVWCTRIKFTHFEICSRNPTPVRNTNSEQHTQQHWSTFNAAGKVFEAWGQTNFVFNSSNLLSCVIWWDPSTIYDVTGCAASYWTLKKQHKSTNKSQCDRMWFIAVGLETFGMGEMKCVQLTWIYLSWKESSDCRIRVIRRGIGTKSCSLKNEIEYRMSWVKSRLESGSRFW